MNLLHVTVAAILIGYVTASTWPFQTEEEVDNELHERYRRSWKKQKQRVPNCPAGSKAVVTCEACPTGYYTQQTGLWQECVSCGADKTTMPDRPHKCVTKCRAGWTWNIKKKKCFKCGEGTAKPEEGNHQCTPCPKYFKPNKVFTACDQLECPEGYEPYRLGDGNMTCAPCRFGYYKKRVGGSDDFCTRCNKEQWTLSTGSIAMSDCVKKMPDSTCEANFPDLVEAVEEVAYSMNENDTIGDMLCSVYGALRVKILIVQVSHCINVTEATSGRTVLPVYRDDTGNVSIADIYDVVPYCAAFLIPDSASSWGSSSSSWWWSSSSSWWSSSSSSWWSSSSLWSSLSAPFFNRPFPGFPGLTRPFPGGSTGGGVSMVPQRPFPGDTRGDTSGSASGNDRFPENWQRNQLLKEGPIGLGSGSGAMPGSGGDGTSSAVVP